QQSHSQPGSLRRGLRRLAGGQDADALVVSKLPQTGTAHRSRAEAARLDAGSGVAGIEDDDDFPRVDGAGPFGQLIARNRGGERSIVEALTISREVGGEQEEAILLIGVAVSGKR